MVTEALGRGVPGHRGSRGAFGHRVAQAGGLATCEFGRWGVWPQGDFANTQKGFLGRGGLGRRRVCSPGGFVAGFDRRGVWPQGQVTVEGLVVTGRLGDRKACHREVLSHGRVCSQGAGFREGLLAGRPARARSRRGGFVHRGTGHRRACSQGGLVTGGSVAGGVGCLAPGTGKKRVVTGGAGGAGLAPWTA